MQTIDCSWWAYIIIINLAISSHPVLCLFQYVDESSNLSDVKINVIESATGKALAVDMVPTSSQLETWLEMHPG